MLSTCAKCEGHMFEIVEQSPSNANYKLWFVQCSTCGNPISSKEYFNSNKQIIDLDKKISDFGGSLIAIQAYLANIEILLRNRR